MNLAQETWEDLLALYLAGEASPATRRLVDEHAKQDPAFARALNAPSMSRSPAPPRAADLAVLQKTQSLLRWKSWILGIAIFLSLTPLSIVFLDGKLVFFLIRDAPRQGIAMWIAAIAAWIGYLMLRKRTSVSGL
jgi:hypothetical protein